jgi:hypothetical protein
MLSLTKKSDVQPVTVPLWHPNFRNFDRLPDTKVVRTAFFINTAAVALAVGMLLWVGQREYTNHNLLEQKAEAQRQIDANKKLDAEALRLSKVFLDEEKKINEVVNFVRVPITLAEFVGLLADSLPKEISIEFVDARMPADGKAGMVQIRGRVAGSPDQASGIASNYVDMLRAHPKLGKVFDPITLNRLDRDAGGEYMAFDISLNVKK